MNDLYAELKQLKNDAYDDNEVLLSYALDNWIKTQPSSSTEGMADLKLILKQYKRGKSKNVNRQVKECVRIIDDWFEKLNRRV